MTAANRTAELEAQLAAAQRKLAALEPESARERARHQERLRELDRREQAQRWRGLASSAAVIAEARSLASDSDLLRCLQELPPDLLRAAVALVVDEGDRELEARIMRMHPNGWAVAADVVVELGGDEPRERHVSIRAAYRVRLPVVEINDRAVAAELTAAGIELDPGPQYLAVGRPDYSMMIPALSFEPREITSTTVENGITRHTYADNAVIWPQARWEAMLKNHGPLRGEVARGDVSAIALSLDEEREIARRSLTGRARAGDDVLEPYRGRRRAVPPPAPAPEPAAEPPPAPARYRLVESGPRGLAPLDRGQP